jgi:hypothetical protein
MRVKVDKSVYPLFTFVGSSLTLATGFSFHNLFNRQEVHLWKQERMKGYPKDFK